MTTIDEVKKLLEFRVNKSGYSGYVAPKEFDLVWNRGSKRHFNKKYKTYDTVEESRMALSPFKTDPTPITISTLGEYTKPSNLLRIDAITATYLGKQIEVLPVEDNRLAGHLSSSYDAPSLRFPIYIEYNNKIQFYPTNLGTAKITYLKNIEPCMWGFTIVNGRAVYNPATSVHPLWDEMNIDEIIYLCGDDLGINLRDQEFQAFNTRKQQQGSI